jgi:hypothetical protein
VFISLNKLVRLIVDYVDVACSFCKLQILYIYIFVIFLKKIKDICNCLFRSKQRHLLFIFLV